MYSSINATPQRPLPGAFLQTPAPPRSNSVPSLPRPPSFRLAPSTSLQRPPGQQQQQQQQNQQQQQSQQPSNQPPSLIRSNSQTQVSQPAISATAAPALSPIERAARTINSNLDHELRFPPLEDYIPQGISSSYDVASSRTWEPFQRTKLYEIPDKVFEQYNSAEVSTMMGLFAELNHAWIAIDNALYLWDYTHPNPELIGFEEAQHTITAIELIRPRAGVFVPTITHLLVVATTTDLYLIGLATQKTPAGVTTISLYQTNMSVSIKGTNIGCAAGSAQSGRLFVAGRTNTDVHEVEYQQEERWFSSKCMLKNRTGQNVSSVLPGLDSVLSILGSAPKEQEHIVQMVLDDSRQILYTLSSQSTIRVYEYRRLGKIQHLITKPLSWVTTQLNFHVARSEIVGQGMKIVSLAPILASESAKLYLVATTNTGIRLYLSASSGWSASASQLPSEMQVYHVKFPPPPAGSMGRTDSQALQPQTPGFRSTPSIDTNSHSLFPTDLSKRFPPGYSFCFAQSQQQGIHSLFISAPDSGRIARVQPGQVSSFIEQGMWVALNSFAQDVGSITAPFAASASPYGFGNELAVQFDVPASDIAVLTAVGIQTFRRRRIVDAFASALQHAGVEGGVEEVIKKFINDYGRSETCATALAVACGQGTEVSIDRVVSVTESAVVDQARRVFIEHGGKAEVDENGLFEHAIENVRPSSRAQGLGYYLTRLVRPVWRSKIMKTALTPTGGLQYGPAVPTERLRDLQRALLNLDDFLEANKSFIEGLSGPDALVRAGGKNEEAALQGEHRTLFGLVKAIKNTIEGIAFVIRLFEDPVDQIMMSLSDDMKQSVRDLTFEKLFCSDNGKALAKELVKAMVNSSIIRGSNIDTVAEALRRQCGSFCSAEDVVIFKAQEQLRKASEAGSESEVGRSLLNESLKLFSKVAATLPIETSESAVKQYIQMSFFAGAIRLALVVAQDRDRGNRALSWLQDGKPENDTRKIAYDSRQHCYKLIESVIIAVDSAQNNPNQNDMQRANIARRKEEAYEEIDNCTDEVFQTYLYDWYLAQGWTDRLLQIQAPFVRVYLQRKSKEAIAQSDLLWKYYAHHNELFEAAQVQLSLAKSDFELSLTERISYLGRAKANATARLNGGMNGLADFGRARSSRQEIHREISDLLEIATIQSDLLGRLTSDARLSDQRKPAVKQELDGKILTLDELYNGYADQANYYDLCLIIYQIADYRSSPDIEACWTGFIEQTHEEAIRTREASPGELVAERVRDLGRKLHCSEITFPIPVVLPLLLNYASTQPATQQPPTSPTSTAASALQDPTAKTWPLDLLLDLSIAPETLLSNLELLYYRSLSEPTYAGSKHNLICRSIVYVAKTWMQSTRRGGGVLLGSAENALGVAELLDVVLADERRGLGQGAELEEARVCREVIGRSVR